MTPATTAAVKGRSVHTLAGNGKQCTTVTSECAGQMYTCEHCNSRFSSHDVLVQHKKLYCTVNHSSKPLRTARNHFKKLLNSFGKSCNGIFSSFLTVFNLNRASKSHVIVFEKEYKVRMLLSSTLIYFFNKIIVYKMLLNVEGYLLL